MIEMGRKEERTNKIKRNGKQRTSNVEIMKMIEMGRKERKKEFQDIYKDIIYIYIYIYI